MAVEKSLRVQLKLKSIERSTPAELYRFSKEDRHAGVHGDLKGITMDQLAGAQKAAIQTGKDMTAQGRTVRYIRSTFVPGEARCMCLFEAPTAQNVRELNDRAKIPYTRVVEALDLTP